MNKDWKLYLSRSAPFRAYKWSGKSDGVVLSVEDARATGMFKGSDPQVLKELLSEANPAGDGLLQDRSVGWFQVPPNSYIFKDASNHYAFEESIFFESKYYPLNAFEETTVFEGKYYPLNEAKVMDHTNTAQLKKQVDKLTKMVTSQQALITDLQTTVGLKKQAVPAARSPLIYRYIRLNDSTLINSPDNLNCITFAFQIDYASNKLSAGWAIAKGENVEKSVGRQIASQRIRSGNCLVFDIVPDQFANTSLVDFVSYNLGYRGTHGVNNLFAFLTKALPAKTNHR